MLNLSSDSSTFLEMFAGTPVWLLANCKHSVAWSGFVSSFFFSCHILKKSLIYIECVICTCLVNRSFFHPSYGSLQLLQSYHRSLIFRSLLSLLSLRSSIFTLTCQMSSLVVMMPFVPKYLRFHRTAGLRLDCTSLD